MSNTFHTHLPLLLLFCTRGLLRMHSHSHAACIYQLDSFLFNLQGLIHASFYTNQLLHQPAFTQTLFDTKHFLQKSTFTPTSFFFTNPFLHKFTFPQTTLYTNQLLHKRVFARTGFYTNHLVRQPALHNPCFGPVGQRLEGQWKALE